MPQYYVMAPVNTYYLTRQLLETPAKKCQATTLRSLAYKVNNWFMEDVGLGFKPENIALVCGAGLYRYLQIEASPEGYAYDLVIISDSPEFLYRFLRQSQDVKMQVDLWIDHNTESWNDRSRKSVNDDNTSSEDLVHASMIAELIRDNIGRELKRLPRLVQFPNYNDEFGNYEQEVMAQAAAMQKIFQKR
ncbi:MAG: hypothetical protein VX730_06895 [Pseudomonadota bacterium]|nr:hypothetical protein [Pseudomonadota bacterium]